MFELSIRHLKLVHGGYPSPSISRWSVEQYALIAPLPISILVGCLTAIFFSEFGFGGLALGLLGFGITYKTGYSIISSQYSDRDEVCFVNYHDGYGNRVFPCPVAIQW